MLKVVGYKEAALGDNPSLHDKSVPSPHKEDALAHTPGRQAKALWQGCLLLLIAKIVFSYIRCAIQL